jgi:hypothetical protein
MGARLLFVANAASGTRNRSPCAQPRSSRAVRAGEKSREESAAKRNGLRFGSSFEEPVVSQRSASAFFLTMRGRAFREGNLAGATRSTGIFIPAHLPFPSARLLAGGPSTAGRSPHTAPGLAANHDRRRRPFPATRTPREAPSMETTKRNIVLSFGKSTRKIPSWPGEDPAIQRCNLDGRLDARVKPAHEGELPTRFRA